MKTKHVQELCVELWDGRAMGRVLPEPIVLTRALYWAVSRDLAECVSYDPEGDGRVRWVRALVRSRARVGAQGRRAQARPAVEALAAFLLGRDEVDAGVERGGW